MSGIEIVREQKNGFGVHGQDIQSDEVYIKISVSLREVLAKFKGARLSVFLALAVNESEICLGRGTALSIYDLATQTDYTARNVLRAVQYLCENRFAVELDERGERGEKLYRVSGYAWFGNPRTQPAMASNSGYDKMSDPTLLGRGHRSKMSDRASNVRGMTKDAPVVVVSKDTLSSSNDLKQQQTISAETCDILRAAHVAEPALSRLSRAVSPDLARNWFEEWVPQAPDSFKAPLAFAIKRLMDDPAAQPPEGERKHKHWWGDEYDKFVNR